VTNTKQCRLNENTTSVFFQLFCEALVELPSSNCSSFGLG
jgi:hypothetical protein